MSQLLIIEKKKFLKLDSQRVWQFFKNLKRRKDFEF